MSRRTFDHNDDTWTVGYDRPLATFYAQVEPRPDVAHDPAVRAAFTHRHPPTGLHDPDDLLTIVVGEHARELPALNDLTATLPPEGSNSPPPSTACSSRTNRPTTPRSHP